MIRNKGCLTFYIYLNASHELNPGFKKQSMGLLATTPTEQMKIEMDTTRALQIFSHRIQHYAFFPVKCRYRNFF